MDIVSGYQPKSSPATSSFNSHRKMEAKSRPRSILLEIPPPPPPIGVDTDRQTNTESLVDRRSIFLDDRPSLPSLEPRNRRCTATVVGSVEPVCYWSCWQVMSESVSDPLPCGWSRLWPDPDPRPRLRPPPVTRIRTGTPYTICRLSHTKRKAKAACATRPGPTFIYFEPTWNGLV